MSVHVDDSQDESVAARRLQSASYVLPVALATLTTAWLMTVRAVDPTWANPYGTGYVFTVLWCTGLMAWALRVVRSRQSRFSILAISAGTAVVAIGLVSPLAALAILSLAMIADLGVVTVTSDRHTWFWRLIQVCTGILGLAHSVRMFYGFAFH